MKKQLFHGSDHIIETPIYGVGKNTMIMDRDSTVPKILPWQRNGRYRRKKTDMLMNMR